MTIDEMARLERPSPKLLNLCVIRAVLTRPGVFFALPVLLCQYGTLRYQFDGEARALHAAARHLESARTRCATPS